MDIPVSVHKNYIKRGVILHILEVCRVSRLFKESEKMEYFS